MIILSLQVWNNWFFFQFGRDTVKFSTVDGHCHVLNITVWTDACHILNCGRTLSRSQHYGLDGHCHILNCGRTLSRYQHYGLDGHCHIISCGWTLSLSQHYGLDGHCHILKCGWIVDSARPQSEHLWCIIYGLGPIFCGQTVKFSIVSFGRTLSHMELNKATVWMIFRQFPGWCN